MFCRDDDEDVAGIGNVSEFFGLLRVVLLAARLAPRVLSELREEHVYIN